MVAVGSSRGRLVAGIDSSTQSCKVVIRHELTGEAVRIGSGDAVRAGSAPHPGGTEVWPEHWWTAFHAAAAQAGGLDDVSALAVAGQQHGLVALDADGHVIRPALLWNDTRSAEAARDLIREFGNGEADWASAVGSVPVASLTITKLRWLRDNEPENAARIAAVALPHDWLNWRIAGYGPAGKDAAGKDSAPLGPKLQALVTDRSDASGTGYFDSVRNEYRMDLVELALGRRDIILPRVLDPNESAGLAASAIAGASVGGALIGPGAGDNAAAALGLDLRVGDVAVSLGTSGVVSAISEHIPNDSSGEVTGFADATGSFLPLVCTLNASRVLDSARSMTGLSYEEISERALEAPSGSGGLVLLPYFEGERTPNRPNATAVLTGMRLDNSNQSYLARAFVEGLVCAMADCLDALKAQGMAIQRVLLIGGGARSEAVRRIAPAVWGYDVEVPEPGEYVANGAARQAAWVLSGGEHPPVWGNTVAPQVYQASPTPSVHAAYSAVRDSH